MKEWLRYLALSRQGLTSPTFGLGLDGTQCAIESLGYIQIDTLSVVERAHHHVLWSRVPDYTPEYLQQLVYDRKVFDYWFHAASYLPMRDYRFALPLMSSVREGKSHPYFSNANPRLMHEIYERIRIDGPTSMKALGIGSSNTTRSWSRGEGKHALDKLFMQGDLTIRERKGMEKIYDLTERVIPADINLTAPSLSEYADYLIDNMIQAHGIFTWKQLTHLRTENNVKQAIKTALEQKIQEGLVSVLNKDKMPDVYIDAQALENTEKPINTLKILSPFDNAIIHRERLNLLFKFDYRLECYVAAHKRTFGYFCLPILFGDQFVGRVDCKADRKEKCLKVFNFYHENQSVKMDSFREQLIEELTKFAAFNQCTELDMGNIV
ncbi:winged helix-turn-helix domain-containing protein [Neisseria sp. Ec49-e6-T10]|uniref:winged helix-turn-helix domain-containing protein n=1 Tax=Neisseria sp. Ec49-e6-T10 TaxID=3140744 RepID=UPI003EC0C6CE